MAANGFTSIKESEVAAIDNKDYDINFFYTRVIVYHEFVPQGQTVNQECCNSILRNMCEALQHHCPDLWAFGQWTFLNNNVKKYMSVPTDFSLHTLLCFNIPCTPMTSLCAIFLFPQLKKQC
jgi:hypothetical protein